jgi:hypothetical protein
VLLSLPVVGTAAGQALGETHARPVAAGAYTAAVEESMAGFLQIDIMSDGGLALSIVDASDTSGKLMTNTSATGVTGAATATIPTVAS